MSHRRSIAIAAAGRGRLAGRSPRSPARSTTRRRPIPKGGTAKPKGPFKTLKVCKGKKSLLPDDPVGGQQGQARRHGQGRPRHLPEGVKITGASKRYIKLIGNPKAPAQGRARGQGHQGRPTACRSTAPVNVTVNGFTAQHYKANGFFAVNTKDYTFTNLQAFLVGVYGIYAFNSVGGTMTDSEAAWNNDSGLLHRADAAAGQADALDRHATSSPTATCSAGRARTCAT